MGLAFVLNNKMPGTSAYRSLIFVPAVIPAVSTAVIWYWILSPKWGLLNGFLATLNITGPPWLTDPAWAKPSLLIMTLWMIGSDMVLYLAGLQDVPAELYEAADLEGAGSWTKMSRVSIPLISRIVFFHFINAMIWASQYFDVPYIVSGQAHGSPNPAMANSLFFYVIYLYQSAFTYLRMGYASALSWILFVVVLGFSVVIVRTSKSWVYYEQQ